ncbi:hypothetical protein K493DRAFT_364062 [Basidiobolus meristosporus CBS 931.73]|uniref:BHLH domain-containing protein n=1 Tax=Basidiobolus meristosporus CBS 931.73 TaxID=1314790 RepID=A0A1Y1WQA0_9FUNG|nr:hypothetical protein K493DRAFT_364062 [Basidiobolus meristosporus CBS 931.73]|eukprot:ORX75565.1 hypothetical protein K493DRAFT_364062 [Basidiobolus meristosporus CBS 931.73]
MNYSGERLGPFPQNHHDYPERSSAGYGEANTRYEARGEPLPPPHLPRLGSDLQPEQSFPFRRHSVAGLPGSSYSLPLPHMAAREAQPSSLSQSFTPNYAHQGEAEKRIKDDAYSSTDSSSLKRKEFGSISTSTPASAFKRRASLCDPLPPPPQVFPFSGSSRNPTDNINAASGSLKLPKIEEIEGYSSEYSEKSPPSTHDRPLPPHHLLDRPAFRHEHMMGRRASLPVISYPHQSLMNERGADQDPSHSSYVFPPPADGDKTSPYSRTPALKVSHKLAERKRRKEMKDLFDELRDNLPVDKNIKTSKWEILSKSIEYIRQLQEGQNKLSQEIQDLRQQVAILKQGRRRSD